VKSDIIMVIIGAGIATYFTRFPLMVLSGKREIPGWLVKFMSFIAPSVLTALIVPVIFIKQGSLDISLSNEYVIAAAITGIAAYLSKNMLVSVITGICTVGLLMYFIR
jgi:branched-subunit amino acid transport protein